VSYGPIRLPLPAVAFDVTPLQNAHRFRGIGTYVRGLAHRLAQQTEIPIEFWSWSGETPVEARPPHSVLALRRVPMPEYRGAWVFAQLAMRRRAQRSRARAVHITDPSALTPLGTRRLLTTVYDLIPLKEDDKGHRAIARAGYRSYINTLKKADTLFAISNQTAADLVDLLQIPASRIQVARPGVDLPPSTGRRDERRRPYFVFIGGPNPNKNLTVLLDAMKLSTDLPEELLIAGHWLPRQVDALNALVGDGFASRVRHVGFVPSGELVDLIRDATALIVPSLMEGFGLPVAEGLAAGAVVLHSRLPVLEETSAGAALTFDPHSAVELAACLRRASAEPQLARDLRRRGRERAAELTWDAAVSNTLAVYRAALDG
jgi:glycosyltransferase involved in cell wall biosynthesis